MDSTPMRLVRLFEVVRFARDLESNLCSHVLNLVRERHEHVGPLTRAGSEPFEEGYGLAEIAIE